MYNLYVSCKKERLCGEIQEALDGDLLPLKVYVHTVAPARIGEQLRRGNADILFCDAGAMAERADCLRSALETNPYVCVVVFGGKAELVQLQKALGLESGERLRFAMLPISRRDMLNILCGCVYCINDAKLADRPQEVYALWKKNRAIVRERFWYDLISGRFSYFSHEALLRKAEEHDVLINNPDKRFLVFIIRIKWEPPRPSDMCGDERYYAMRNLLEEIFEIDAWSIPVVALSPRCFAVIWHYGSEATMRRAVLARDTYVQCYRKYLQRDVACIIGEPCSLAGLSRYNSYIFNSGEQVDETGPAAGDPILEIKQFIDNNIDRSLSRQRIAEHVFLNPDYMATLFKKRTGQCLSAYIAERKMDRARRLLIRNGYSITEVAAELGYTNFSYFSRLFKQMVGLTPSEYRNQYLLSAASRIS